MGMSLESVSSDPDSTLSIIPLRIRSHKTGQFLNAVPRLGPCWALSSISRYKIVLRFTLSLIRTKLSTANQQRKPSAVVLEGSESVGQ